MLAGHKNTKAEYGTEQTTVPHSAFKDEWQYGSAAKAECLPGAVDKTGVWPCWGLLLPTTFIVEPGFVLYVGLCEVYWWEVLVTRWC